MSYRIEYGPPIPTQYAKKRNRRGLRILTAAFFILFAFLVRQYFPSAALQLRRILLPQHHSVTQIALDSFMGDLRNGESLRDSFTAFCAYIVNHGKAVPY